MRPRNYRIAVPPGVGDVYWVLTKLQAFKRAHGIERVELCVQRAGPGRSTDWANMVDFVHASSFFPFRPNDELLTKGISYTYKGVDVAMWPNAIVDRGEHLRNWLPELELDLDFPVRTVDMGAPRVVVYASSEAINQAWVSNLGGPQYWVDLIAELSQRVGPVTLIGAEWDRRFSEKLPGRPPRPRYEDLTASTTLPQVADILKKARVVVGVISGMTILANHFRTPTIAFYPDAHDPAFPFTWQAPDAPYGAILASTAPSAAEVAERAAALARP